MPISSAADKSSDISCLQKNFFTVRLVDGSSANEGRVEVYINGTWGTVCNNHWSNIEALVVCQELGYQSVSTESTAFTHFGEGTGPIHLDDVACQRSDASLLDCDHGGVGIHNCAHSEDVGVICLTGLDISNNPI